MQYVLSIIQFSEADLLSVYVLYTQKAIIGGLAPAFVTEEFI